MYRQEVEITDVKYVDDFLKCPVTPKSYRQFAFKQILELFKLQNLIKDINFNSYYEHHKIKEVISLLKDLN